MEFKPINQDLLARSRDPNDARLSSWVQPIRRTDLPQLEPGFVIAGYPDDEGVRLSLGRPGAAEGPDRIRQYLYRMTPHPQISASVPLYDIGNLAPEGRLEERHQWAREVAGTAISCGHFWMSFGGGHDYGFADGGAVLDQLDGSPLFVNFDAHLDVRPLDFGFTSGTPFFRLLSEAPETAYAVVGAQPNCNSQAHWQWCEAHQAQIISLEDIVLSGEPLVTTVSRRLGRWLERRRPLFLSVDLDAFAAPFAPGCSQSWPCGLTPDAVLPLLTLLLGRLDLKAVGLYEVAPPLDVDNRTAKLAAQLAHWVIFQTLAASSGSPS